MLCPKREELYSKVPPRGEPIPIGVTPYAVRDDEPDDAEVREVVRNRLKNGRAGGSSQICAEDIKQGQKKVKYTFSF